MPTSSKSLLTAIVLTGITTTSFALLVILPWADGVFRRRRRRIDRDTLPRSLKAWRLADSQEAYRIWEVVRPAFDKVGMYLWPYDGVSSIAHPDHTFLSSGFAYVTPTRGEKWANDFKEFNCQNELTHGGTTADSLNTVIRIVVMGEEGRRHLEILRKLARGTTSLFTDNHVVPLWKEVNFEDITFVVSPYVGHSMEDCYGWWAKNSVGDIVDMILQTIEAIVFVHDLGIVHRDLCKSNYVVQWHPESLETMRVPLCRPRVFLIDFEMAYEFPPHIPAAQRLLVGTPIEDYRRPIPPEIASGEPYDPFKADVWQLAESFSDFRTDIPQIDEVLSLMFEQDSLKRLSALDARDQLAAAVHNIPPSALLIPPVLLRPPPFLE